MKPRIQCVLTQWKPGSTASGSGPIPAADAAAIADAIALAGIAAITARTGSALAGAIALALACIGRRRTGARLSPGRNRDPE
jgi:hypothetical protein